MFSRLLIRELFLTYTINLPYLVEEYLKQHTDTTERKKLSSLWQS